MRLGTKDFELIPMNLIEAIETMFVLKPYVEKMMEGETIFDKFESLIGQIQGRDPNDLIRLLAYMLHIDADEIIESIEKREIIGPDAITALTEGFKINPLPDLLNSGLILGILPRGWGKDVRTS